VGPDTACAGACAIFASAAAGRDAAAGSGAGGTAATAAAAIGGGAAGIATAGSGPDRGGGPEKACGDIGAGLGAGAAGGAADGAAGGAAAVPAPSANTSMTRRDPCPVAEAGRCVAVKWAPGTNVSVASPPSSVIAATFRGARAPPAKLAPTTCTRAAPASAVAVALAPGGRSMTTRPKFPWLPVRIAACATTAAGALATGGDESVGAGGAAGDAVVGAVVAGEAGAAGCGVSARAGGARSGTSSKITAENRMLTSRAHRRPFRSTARNGPRDCGAARSMQLRPCIGAVSRSSPATCRCRSGPSRCPAVAGRPVADRHLSAQARQPRGPGPRAPTRGRHPGWPR